MKHKSSREVYAYWDGQRGTRPAPERTDIDPAAIRHVLADTFVLAADFVEENRFRLAGTKVCALFCREMKDRSFLDLWHADSRKQVAAMLAIVDDETLGVAAGVTGVNAENSEIDLELVMLPLARRGHARVRALGVLAPLTMPYWLGDKPVTQLRLGAMRHIGANLDRMTAPSLTPVAPGGQRQHGFVVYQGGKKAETATISATEPPSAA